MNIISNLSDNFKIHVYYPVANNEDIKILKVFSKIVIPEDYLSIVPQMDIEMQVANKRYIRIWEPKSCIEINQDYSFQNYIPHSLAIGDNEGGEAIVYLNGQKGFGLYFVDFGDIDVDSSKFISSSLTNLLIYNQGIECILNPY